MKKVILLGTTNPSKQKRYADMLCDYAVDFITLDEMGITTEPDENGSDPRENASIKARFYGRYCDRVICDDAGLYFSEIPVTDKRQPGLHIRSPQGVRLNDEEMISYYSGLIRSLGGEVSAYYITGTAVCNSGIVTAVSNNSNGRAVPSFRMTDKPSPRRHNGWPLDSLSLYNGTSIYFSDDIPVPCDPDEEKIKNEYSEFLVKFLADSLELKIL